jgi:hypothetical protein
VASRQRRGEYRCRSHQRARRCAGQIPDAYRHGTPLLVRADTAGCTKAFLAHTRQLRTRGMATEFSVGWAITDRERAAIADIPTQAWTAAIDTAGDVCDAQEVAVAELTGLLTVPADYPDGMRIIARMPASKTGEASAAAKTPDSGISPPESLRSMLPG